MNIFFVLSGFLITGILIDTKHSIRYFSSFYARRVLRIAPLYFATLAFAFVILPAIHVLPHTVFDEQFPYWLYLYNWTAATGHQALGLVHFWSLAVEEQFYLVWPVVLVFLPVRRMPAVFLSLLGASFLFRASLFVLGEPSRYAYFLTPSRTEDLCFGALAAWLVRDAPALRWLQPKMIRLAAVFAALFALAYLLGKGFEANKWPALLFGTTAVCALAALAIIYSTQIYSTQETRPRWWGHSVLRWLGTYSYGIYIFHQPIMSVANAHLKGATLPVYTGVMACAIALSCATAWVSFHAFERHFLKWKARFAT